MGHGQAYLGGTWIPVTPPSEQRHLFRAPGQGAGVGGRWLDTRVAPLDHQGGNEIATGGA